MPIVFADPRFWNEYRGKRGLYAVTTQCNKKDDVYKVGLTGDFVKRFNQYRRCSLQKPTTAIIVEALIVDFTMNLKDAEKIMLNELSAYRQSQWDTEVQTEWVKVPTRETLFGTLKTTAERLGGRLIRKFEKELAPAAPPPVDPNPGLASTQHIVDQRNSMVLIQDIQPRMRPLPRGRPLRPDEPGIDDMYWQEEIPTVVWERWISVDKVRGIPEYEAWLAKRSRTMAAGVRALGDTGVPLPRRR